MSVAEVVAQMQAEALEWGRNRELARSTGTVVSASRTRTNREMEEERAAARERNDHSAMSLIQDRDPCVCCGTRKDWHGEFGCKRWRAG